MLLKNANWWTSANKQRQKSTQSLSTHSGGSITISTGVLEGGSAATSPLLIGEFKSDGQMESYTHGLTFYLHGQLT